MSTRYYLASVNNATSPAVRAQSTASKATEGFASASIMLANAGLYVTNMQELTRAQYDATYAPFWHDVGIKPE